MSAPVQFEGRVEEITYSEGWTDETLLALALEFIGDRPETSEAFLAFLESRTYVAEDSEPDDSMDGDAGSALASAGFGTDEEERRSNAIMGSCDFTAVGRGSNAEKAYQNAVEEAEYEHGHDGYNGTISTSRGFYEIKGKSLLDYSKALREAIKAKKAEIKGKVYQWATDKESDAYRLASLESTVTRVMAARKTEDKGARAWAMLEAEMSLEDGKRIRKWEQCACVKVEPGKYFFAGIAAC